MEKKYLINGVEKTRAELFNEQELALINSRQEILNSVGFGDIDLTLLTVLERSVSEQKFYRLNGLTPEDFVPIDNTQGGFADYIKVLRSYANIDGDIDTWLRGNDTDNAHRGQGGVKLDDAAVKIWNLDKMLSYSLFELRQSMQTGVWNVVKEKEIARKADHDISYQKAILAGNGGQFSGLLNQSTVSTDATILPTTIGAMTAAQFRTFLASVFSNYFAQTGYTQMPNTLVVPYTDFLAMSTNVDETYALFGKTMKARLEEVFKDATGRADARILPLAYCEASMNSGFYKYALYNKEFDTLRAYRPFNYDVVQGTTVDGMNFQNTAYSRSSDVFVNRPKEMLYMTVEA